ncbi:MAG: hypothetical protein BWK76_25990 [Desulfobulbaceae bacterium A2]|nr:MAG: hypothetical protein BWK76_25990 [Desulfobulbaceae bacterium A2]
MPSIVTLFFRKVSTLSRKMGPARTIRFLASWLAVTLEYWVWQLRHEPGLAELNEQRNAVFPAMPRISIVVPLYNTPARFLKALVASVRRQTYANWQLCLLDGGSTAPHMTPLIARLASGDSRITVQRLAENRGIAGNTNAAIALATGTWVALLDHDDLLTPWALYEVVQQIHATPQAEFIYSDEDKVGPDGRLRFSPHFKSDYFPDTFRSGNYICHFAVIKRTLGEAVGWFRPGFDGAQDHELFLRLTEATANIVHIPKILYHWRISPLSTAGFSDSKPHAYEAGRRAIQEHLQRTGRNGTVVAHPEHPGIYQVMYGLPPGTLVSIIIPTHDRADLLAPCVDSIVSRTAHEQYEIIIIDHNSQDAATVRLLDDYRTRPNVTVISWRKSFNWSAMNNAAARVARGRLLCFLNNDTRIISPDWLERMGEFALQPDVGAVGAKLFSTDDRIQHAGISVGGQFVAVPVHPGAHAADTGYVGRLVCIQNVQAVTGACLMVEKETFWQAGGFDETLSVAYNDVSFCLTLNAAGKRTVFTPYAQLYHDESASRGQDTTPEKMQRLLREREILLARWPGLETASDPCWNRNLRHRQAPRPAIR